MKLYAKFCGIVVSMLLVLSASAQPAAPRNAVDPSYFPDPARSRLIFGPTARGLGAGAGYAALYEIFFPFAAVGVGRGVAFGGGISLLPGLREQLLYVTPKLTLVEREQIALAVGVVATTLLGEEAEAGIVYSVGTFGNETRALTVGVGLVFDETQLFEHLGVLVAGEYRLAQSVKLITENYAFSSDVLLLSVGARLLSPRFTGDLGLATTPEAFDQEGFPFLPWLGFTYHFGHRR